MCGGGCVWLAYVEIDKVLFFLLLLLLRVKCVNKLFDPLKKQEKKQEKRSELEQHRKSKSHLRSAPPAPPVLLLLVAAKWFYDLHPQCMGWCMVYISIYIQIYMQGTFVYCASFVFVVNKLKMRPNWQRRHSICMRGVRGTLDRQPRLEELCAHGQHKRCFKQPATPSPQPSTLFALCPYQVISQTL